jgi:hypothetical protein
MRYVDDLTLRQAIEKQLNKVELANPFIANPATDATPEHGIAYAERAFLRELLAHNPEAIQSDLGLMEMMSQYRL